MDCRLQFWGKVKKKSISIEKTQSEIVSLMSSWGYRHFKPQTSVARQHKPCLAIHSVCGLNCSSLGEEGVAVGKKPKIHKRLLHNLRAIIAISCVGFTHEKKIFKVSNSVEMGQIVVPTICNPEFVLKVNIILNIPFYVFLFSEVQSCVNIHNLINCWHLNKPSAKQEI